MLSCCGLTRDTFITRQSRDVHEQKKLLTSAPTSRSYRYSRNEVEGINVIEFVLSEVENDIILQNESFYLYRKFLFLVLPASQHLLGNLFDPDSWGFRSLQTTHSSSTNQNHQYAPNYRTSPFCWLTLPPFWSPVFVNGLHHAPPR